jgi:pyridoxamine 5'-phosphate oxidase family protein
MVGAFAVLAAALIVVAACLTYGAVAVRGRRKGSGRENGVWHLFHYAQDGHTVVAVARGTPEGHVIEKHVVARIPDTDENWSNRFVEAKLDAEERAFHLNADSPHRGSG